MKRLRKKVNRQHLLRAAFEILEAEPISADIPISNAPFLRSDLQAKRTWSPRELTRILKIESRIGHIENTENGYLRLSEAGFGEAARITRNHRLWEVYLVTHADIAPSHVDRDADMVEHVLEAELVSQLEEVLRSRDTRVPLPTSPHQIPATTNREAAP